VLLFFRAKIDIIIETTKKKAKKILMAKDYED
jgi:hypothetical protein